MKSSLTLVLVVFINTAVSFSQTALLTNIEDLSSSFTLDMRYATENNFLEEVLYDCGTCLLLPETAAALNQANLYFNSMGYRIKIWDCYRPVDVQVKMFAKVPNPMYVADPKEGSIHNRGGAVDLTLETLDGIELDMGTNHDHFGREAHIDNFDLPEAVLNNRDILETGMKQYGFQTIQSEWWHFNHTSASGKPVMNEPLSCE